MRRLQLIARSVLARHLAAPASSLALMATLDSSIAFAEASQAGQGAKAPRGPHGQEALRQTADAAKNGAA